MTGDNVALDTSVAVFLLNDERYARQFLDAHPVIFLPAVTVGELLYGAANSARAGENLATFRAFIGNCVVLAATVQTAEIYARTRHSLKIRGFPIPDGDIWIAAAAIEHDLPLATRDAHFNHVEGLTVIPG